MIEPTNKEVDGFGDTTDLTLEQRISMFMQAVSNLSVTYGVSLEPRATIKPDGTVDNIFLVAIDSRGG